MSEKFPEGQEPEEDGKTSLEGELERMLMSASGEMPMFGTANIRRLLGDDALADLGAIAYKHDRGHLPGEREKTQNHFGRIIEGVLRIFRTISESRKNKR